MDLNQRLFGFCLLLFSVLVSGRLQAQIDHSAAAPKTIPSREAVEVISTARQGDDLEHPQALLSPGNDNCASAATLTVGAACVTGTTSTASTQVGEYLCINPGGGITPETVWYRFTATSTSMVLGVVLTNTSNCATVLAVYGPFASGGGCLPGAGNQLLCQNMGLIDPGFHPLLSGLTIGQDYLVQVQGNNCGGGSDRFANFCISINTPSANQSAGGASIINNCGTAFTGGTTGGHWANGTSIGANNLDNNVGTSITGASEVGDDVTFVVNNVSWFTFCNGNASACNWSILLNGISNCLLPSLNAGVQAAVFTGTPAALTNVAISPSRVAPGGSWSSGTFSVGASSCAYIMVDGFAGDECNYNLTLTNVSCPCVVVPIELAYLSGRNMPTQIHLEWMMAAEDGVNNFLIERSIDGIQFDLLTDNIARSQMPNHRYVAVDQAPMPGWNYYRLSAVDANGNVSMLKTAAVYRYQGAGLDVLVGTDGEQVNLNISTPTAGDALIELLDIHGRSLKTQNAPLQVGNNQISLNSIGLAKGMYILRIHQGQLLVSRKFDHR
ncbi:MAG: T9SS type A sorting domain-containing protein [Bacteroidetes bacterium]|nr:T9SS type A sorting domain-containing protein [Bacteroidota bacterium]